VGSVPLHRDEVRIVGAEIHLRVGVLDGKAEHFRELAKTLTSLTPSRNLATAPSKGLPVRLDYFEVDLLWCRGEENKGMLSTVRAVVREGKIELLDRLDLPEGSKLLVTVLPDEEASFWLEASQASLDRIWDNPDDDVYASLLDA
jgi:hypothetical protein